MAHPRHRGAVELDPSPRSQLGGEIFEMPGESMVPRAEEPGRKPVQAQDGDVVQANPWPFYLDQDVRTEARVDVEEEEKEKPGKANAKGEEQPLANPWPYFGPMSPSEEDGPGVDGLGIIKTEGFGHVEAKIEDASAAPPPLRLGSHGVPAGNGASSPPLPPDAASESSPPVGYPAPLRVSRKQVAPAFRPYLPPAENIASVAPLHIKHQRPSDGPHGDGTTVLPYRPYRPAGHEDEEDATCSSPRVHPQAPQPASSPPAQFQGSQSIGAVTPQPPLSPQVTPTQATTGVASASSDLAQQHHNHPHHQQQQKPPGVSSSGSAEAPLVGVMPQHQHQQANQPAATDPPSLPPPLPHTAPPVQVPVPVVAVAEHSPIAAPAPYHSSQPHAPPHPAPTGSPYQPSSSPSHPSPSTGYSRTSPSPSHPSPALGPPLTSSPVPGHLAYGQPHSAPTSSVPSPEMTSFQFQPIYQAQPPAQQFTPPPPTSSYDIPQRTYAPSTMSPPPQPPRPEFQQAPMDAYQQYPQPQPSPTYGYAGAPRPGTQPPSATNPSVYNAPYGPAIAPHQHQYPTQPTYAAPNGNAPSSPNSAQAQYASPPLPPRPATTQPQLFAGFTSQNVVAYPPPPRRVFSPPPAAPALPPRRQSGGTSSGRLFSSSSALKWIDKTGKGLENKLDAVLGSQGSSNRPPPQPPRPT
ncbi:hypothetical protein V8C35DRAFT_311272 [Trichoderma chlorosporum]